MSMAKYAIATRPLIERLAINGITQAWFADDSTAGIKLPKLKQWWERIKEEGPKYGYFPKPSKCYLILKNEDILEVAKEMFSDVKITCDGHRHIGAALGSEAFEKEHVSKKVAN